MRVVCAHCLKVLDERNPEVSETSHGICEDCIRIHFPKHADKIIASMKKSKTRFRDR